MLTFGAGFVLGTIGTLWVSQRGGQFVVWLCPPRRLTASRWVAWRSPSCWSRNSRSSSQLFFYDVAPDGKKILLNIISQQVNQSITMVANWTEELKK